MFLLRHMQHQELWRAVGTHYGPTRIYGPTGHAIGGTAQQALRSFYRSYVMEHPKKMTVAQAVNPRSDAPSEVRIILRQHSTLEISPLITIITAD
jgi:hypothetical protein